MSAAVFAIAATVVPTLVTVTVIVTIPAAIAQSLQDGTLKSADNQDSFLAVRAALEASHTLEMEIVYKFELEPSI